MRSLRKHNVTPNFGRFNFRFVWFSGCLQKKFLKKLKKRIYWNKGHFRSIHCMLLDLCRKKWRQTIFHETLSGRFLQGHALKRVNPPYSVIPLKVDGTSFPNAGILVTTAHVTREICPRDLKYKKSKTNMAALKLLHTRCFFLSVRDWIKTKVILWA